MEKVVKKTRTGAKINTHHTIALSHDILTHSNPKKTTKEAMIQEVKLKDRGE